SSDVCSSDVTGLIICGMLFAVFHPVMRALRCAILERGFTPSKRPPIVSVLSGILIRRKVLFLNSSKLGLIALGQDHNLTPTVIVELLTKFPRPTRTNPLRQPVRPNRPTAPHNARSRPLSVHSTP